jgi:uncharacterized repeat protein (TIGR01451 family)
LRLRGLAAWVAAATFACAVPAHAHGAAPLVTVGVDVTSATATQATYALYVANRGDAPAPNTVVTNTVPANTSYASSDRMPMPAATPCVAGLPAGGTCRWALGDLPPGGSATVAVTYSLDQGASGYTVGNTATAQTGGAAPVAGDPGDVDHSLVRQIHMLDVDGHVDGAQPGKNFGACTQLDVRRDGARTAFADNDSVGNYDSGSGALSTAERVWSARVDATVASITPGASMTLSLHPVVSGSWTEGSGACAGVDGSGHDLRAAAKPETAPSPVATALTGGPGLLAWDVTAALDSAAEVLAFQGFEFRSGGNGNGSDTVSLQSSEGPAANRPRLVTVRTGRERGRCIDSDVETGSGPSDRLRRFDAYVTELESNTDRVEGPGGDGCPGFPLGGAGVVWELDDDAPDSYIASLAGTATTRGVDSAGGAGPNSGSTSADGGGRTFMELGRGDPWAPLGNDAEVKVAAAAMRPPDAVSDPNSGAPHGVDEPDDPCGNPAAPSPCGGTGEGPTEDDARHTWLAPLGAKPIVTPAVGPSGGSGPPTGSPGTPARAALRSVTLGASAARGGVGREVHLTGRLVSTEVGCTGPREFVQILRRRAGTSQFSDYASGLTGADGGFDVPILLDASSDYMAVAPERAGCDGAASPAVPLVTTGRVSTWTTGRGERRTVRGSVVPALASRVVLERRAGRRWLRAVLSRTSRRGTFAIPLRAVWRGRRSFRVRWIAPPGGMYQGAVSRPFAIAGR